MGGGRVGQRLAVRPELLDRRCLVETAQICGDDLLGDLVLQLVLDLVEGRRGLGALVGQQDDMPAELALHRGLGVLALVQLVGRSPEFRDHVAVAEIAEVAAIGGARILGFLLGELGEIGTLVELGDDVLGLGLGGDEDVAGPQLFLGLHGLRHYVIFLLQGRIAQLVLQLAAQQHLADRLILIGSDERLDLGVVLQLLLAPLVDHQSDVDQPVDQGREILIDLVAVLGRQRLGRGDDVRPVQGLAIDDGDHRIARRGGGLGGCAGRALSGRTLSGCGRTLGRRAVLSSRLGQCDGGGKQRQAGAGGEPLERSNHDEIPR